MEDQFDLVLKKVEDTFQKKFDNQSGFDNIEKLEKLFERLISTISEKGIPINFQNHIKNIDDKLVKEKDIVQSDLETVSDLEDVEDAEVLEEFEEAGSAEDDKVEIKQDKSKVDEAETVEDAEDLEEFESVEETGNETEIKQEISKTIENETEEAEELEEMEELESVDDAGNLTETSIDSENKAEEVDDLEEFESIEDAGEIKPKTENEVSDEAWDLEEVSNSEDHIIDIISDETNKPDNKMGINKLKKPKINDNEVDLPEIIEIGDEEEKIDDLEDIFDNKDKVELLKVKTSDFINHENKKEEDFPVAEEVDFLESLEPVEEEKNQDDFTVKSVNEFPTIDNDKIQEQEIPKIPEEFYNNNVIDDELTQEIKKIERQKTSLQLLLEDIYEKLKPSQMSLLIKLQTKNSFMQTFQKGFKNAFIDRIELDSKNIIVQHIFSTERLVYISDMEKTKRLFQNIEFENEYVGVKSLLIYPVKIFGKIRSLLILAFSEDVKGNLEVIIPVLEKNKDNLKKNIMKLI